MERWKLAFLIGLGFQVPVASAQLVAFDGAEGFGRFAAGARANLGAASVYHVTNLNDSGAGSFRDAVSKSNRFVVFDVGGILLPSSALTFASNLTIAGQTAPGGFTVYGNRAAFHGADNLISRHWAVRLGTSQGREDAASMVRGQNMMFDHMSITWGVDGTFDINPDTGAVIDNITIQNSIVGQGLDSVGHSTGGLMTLGNGHRFSIIKSLFAANVTRNPKVRGENEFINNVVYAYETAGYIMGDTAATSHANAEGNYFIEGPVNGSSPFASGTASFHIYGNDNWVDSNRNGVLDGAPITSYPGADVLAARNPFPTVASMTAQQAVEYVLRNVGPSITRDTVDQYIVDGVASYGTAGGVILREQTTFPGYGTDPKYLNARARLVDTDNDGIADNWESAHGLNPALATDWKGLNAAGYTRLEEYVNELGSDGETILSNGGDWANVATWSGAAPTLADSAVVVGNLGVTGGNAFARRLAVGGNLGITGGTLDVFDTATVDGTLSIAGGTATFGRVVLGSTAASASLTLSAGSTIQTGPIAGNATALLTFDGGTFRALGAPNVSVATAITAAGGTLDTNGYAGLYSGKITGAGAMTKAGAGTLTLSGDNAYAGGTNVTGGNVKLTNSRAAGTGAINVASTANGVLLGNGVTVANDIRTAYNFEVLDVPDANANATYAGNLTRNGSGQVRLQASGANATLNLTGSVAAPNGFFLRTGNVVVRGTGSITGNGGAVGRATGATVLTLQDNATFNIGSFSVGGGQALTTAAITVKGNANFSTGAGNLDLLSSTTVTATSTLNLDGGTASVNGFTKSSVAGQTSTLNFNGGTLRYTGNVANASFLPALVGLTANVGAGGARIDDNGQAITIAGPLLHSAALTGVDGGLTKLGAGTLALAGVNTYTGATAVNAGTLVVNGSIAGAVAVANGATLGGNGTVNGAMNVAGGATLSPGNSPGILNAAGGATLAAGADFVIELEGATAGVGHDQLNVTGAVALAGADLIATLGGAPAIGDRLFILKNDGVDAIVGAFAGLPEGATFALTSAADGQRYGFAISYRGDAESNLGAGGNDVVLTRLAAVPEPATLASLALLAAGLRRRRRRTTSCT